MKRVGYCYFVLYLCVLVFWFLGVLFLMLLLLFTMVYRDMSICLPVFSPQAALTCSSLFNISISFRWIRKGPFLFLHIHTVYKPFECRLII